MCRLNAGLQDELDALYPHEDRNSTKMMDRALSMLLYSEYVPMPVSVAPTLCPNFSSPQKEVKKPSPLAILSSSSTCIMFDHGMDLNYDPERSERNVSELTAAFSQATLEEGMVSVEELAGWDVSMSPLQVPLSSSPPRQTLFLNDFEKKTLFLGREHGKDVIKYVRSGMLEPRYPKASVFIRSVSPSEDATMDPASSWSSLADNESEETDTEWIIA